MHSGMATVLITGANRGIGLELARALHARGERVVACCRSVTPELHALGVVVHSGVDVASAESVARLASDLRDQPIDWLLLNAGVLRADSLDELSLDLDGVREQIEVNALGPLRVTRAMTQNLRPGSKIGIVTSRMGSMGDNSSGGYYGYRMSKAALNAAGVSLARDLAPRGVTVAILHPGFVRTEMTGGRGSVPPETAARQLVARMDELNDSNSGTFWHADGQILPW